jgi:Zn-dependent metalloprotease
LKYIDPDGRYEYETELLGKKIKIKISEDIRKKDPEAFKKIKTQIDNAIAKINAGKDNLKPEQVKAINSMKGIEVRNDISFSFMNPNNKVFNITQRFAEGGDPDWFTGAIIHDAFHADQARRGAKVSGIEREKEASRFAADVAERLGLSPRTIEGFRKDAKEGHSTPKKSPYTKPPKKKP